MRRWKCKNQCSTKVMTTGGGSLQVQKPVQYQGDDYRWRQLTSAKTSAKPRWWLQVEAALMEKCSVQPVIMKTGWSSWKDTIKQWVLAALHELSYNVNIHMKFFIKSIDASHMQNLNWKKKLHNFDTEM